jgi:hypothetical protein
MRATGRCARIASTANDSAASEQSPYTIKIIAKTLYFVPGSEPFCLISRLFQIKKSTVRAEPGEELGVNEKSI